MRSMVLPQSVSNAEKPWTEKELARLGEFAASNIPPCVIGIRLGRPQAAVQQKAAQAGITLQPAQRPPYGR
ncbi:hypothetical protein ACFVWG_25645 [Kribbella sp. NPDC058245]|uniref:hypothetical protein n=1 Tax=Kribbella sp. NPDC058245 TaxID=3346399 RepID=UPI0036E52AB2